MMCLSLVCQPQMRSRTGDVGSAGQFLLSRGLCRPPQAVRGALQPHGALQCCCRCARGRPSWEKSPQRPSARATSTAPSSPDISLGGHSNINILQNSFWQAEHCAVVRAGQQKAPSCQPGARHWHSTARAGIWTLGMPRQWKYVTNYSVFTPSAQLVC